MPLSIIGGLYGRQCTTLVSGAAPSEDFITFGDAPLVDCWDSELSGFSGSSMGMACMAGSSDWNMGGGLSAVDSYWG
ncbi:MAG TPA: hypothetical protein VFC03_01495, partial [Acidimicrobiales bacterium]|nr:hypothetical protein [Acidimicrobiales bacterium]